MMGAALAMEWAKLRRSRIVWSATLMMGIGVPMLAAGFLRAATTGSRDQPLSLKVQAMLIGAGWPAYLAMTAQILSVAMLLATGVVVAWCFGREFVDRTISSLYGLPISRATIAAAKFIVLTTWGAAVSSLVTILAVALAPLAGLALPDGTAVVWLGKLTAVGLSGVVLALPVAFVASAARGYLPGIVALVLVVVVTQLVTVIGWGHWFPYAVPSIWVGMAGPAASALFDTTHLALVPATAMIMIAATLLWWRRAEIR